MPRRAQLTWRHWSNALQNSPSDRMPTMGAYWPRRTLLGIDQTQLAYTCASCTPDPASNLIARQLQFQRDLGEALGLPALLQDGLGKPTCFGSPLGHHNGGRSNADAA